MRRKFCALGPQRRSKRPEPAGKEYAAVLPANLRINSTLYRMEDGTCYVYVQKGGASYERYSRACIQAMEFAALYAADEQKIRYLEEHGECLIREKALKKLRA